MRVVQINATCGIGSTGKICVAISELLTERGVENYILHSGNTNGYKLGIACANKRYTKLQAGKSKALGNYGFNSKKETKEIIRCIEKIQPDIVHLHNIHGHDCNLKVLFQYFREKQTSLIWTFHDCWAFTGYCPHFSSPECDQWETKCTRCPQKKQFSWIFDRSEQLYETKRKLLADLDLMIVTPSRWLEALVKRSFLKNYPTLVINNGIDLKTFKPTSGDFREKNGISERYIVLGVAFGWGTRKGLDVFAELSFRLPKDQYKIILIGTDENVDKQLPSNILSIHRTQNQAELAEIYTAADVFVNPTREDNYPTVNMEALACGTPVLTFDTGGSPEIVDDSCGVVVARDDVDAIEKEIVRICTAKPYSEKRCAEKALEFNKTERFEEYLNLYERINAARTERH